MPVGSKAATNAVAEPKERVVSKPWQPLSALARIVIVTNGAPMGPPVPQWHWRFLAGFGLSEHSKVSALSALSLQCGLLSALILSVVVGLVSTMCIVGGLLQNTNPCQCPGSGFLLKGRFKAASTLTRLLSLSERGLPGGSFGDYS